MLGPFATANRRTRHSPGVATVARLHCRTPPAHRCPRRRRRRQQQRQRVIEGTAMAPWNGPNKEKTLAKYIALSATVPSGLNYSCFLKSDLLPNVIVFCHVTENCFQYESHIKTM